MNPLRKAVERVVRPIWASTWRKNHMREELLAHLEQILAQEEARAGGDDTGALRRTIERLGEPHTLTAELQATVPLWERWGFMPLPLKRLRRRPGETIDTYCGRAIRWQLWWVTVLWTGFVLLLPVMAPRRPDTSKIVLAVLLMYAHLVGFLLLAEAIRRTLPRLGTADSLKRRRARRRIGVMTAAVTALFAATAAAVLLLMEWTARVPLIPPGVFWGVTLASAAAGLPLVALQVWSNVCKARQFDEWDGIDLAPDSSI